MTWPGAVEPNVVMDSVWKLALQEGQRWASSWAKAACMPAEKVSSGVP